MSAQRASSSVEHDWVRLVRVPVGADVGEKVSIPSVGADVEGKVSTRSVGGEVRKTIGALSVGAGVKVGSSGSSYAT